MKKADRKLAEYVFFKSAPKKAMEALGNETLLKTLREMLLIRHFEIRAEAAYQRGLIGGFFHSYMGQEAIQTAAVVALGREKNWWVTTYRCHGLASLLGATPEEMMAELYGKIDGNALGRGGSMHFFGNRLLGGFGIVGGHLPIATGAAFSLKYQEKEGIAICFFGDGAVAQGAMHESLNLAALWDLPCIYVIENNQWGMGTPVNRAICTSPIAQNFAMSYGISSYTFDGMDFFNCYQGFKEAKEEVEKKGRPLLIEVMTERFKGHSVSDPGFYRTKEELEKAKKRDPIFLFTDTLIEHKILTEETFKRIDDEEKAKVIAAIAFAEKSMDPDPLTLEEDVFAP